jgi:arsenite methyltransferase
MNFSLILLLAAASTASGFVVTPWCSVASHKIPHPPASQCGVSTTDPIQGTTATTSRRRNNDAMGPPDPLLFDGIRASVSKYYGQELKSSDDLKTNACCTGGAPPAHIREAIKKIHPEVVSRYYGCGLCLPQYPLDGAKILDLGSGAGRDVYIASQLVGKTGRVVGVDMTDEQLEVANRHIDYHAEKFGYANVEFKKGYLENLEELQLEPGSFDVIISNCVINLCADKEAVLRGCLNLLKPGGELYFSDVYANRRVPKSLQENEVLWGECLSGALYWNDFENMARRVGFTDPRLVEDTPITVSNAAVERLISASGDDALGFYSATYRLWKLDLEPHCEDYGQAVIYKGNMDRYPSGWLLDKGHYFEAGRVRPVCGNTYTMLHETRLREFFDFVGTWDHHYGIFEGCGSSMPFGTGSGSSPSAGKGASTGGCC